MSNWSQNHPKISHDLDTVGSQVIDYMAEREGFEPSIRDYRIHTFQACSFSHSDTSPGLDARSILRGRGRSLNHFGLSRNPDGRVLAAFARDSNRLGN